VLRRSGSSPDSKRTSDGYRLSRHAIPLGALENGSTVGVTYTTTGDLTEVNHVHYQMDADPDTLMMAVIFSDKDAYMKNAGSPEQNERYEQMVALLDGPPEWNDGEIVYPAT
jgi:hypothetical protein